MSAMRLGPMIRSSPSCNRRHQALSTSARGKKPRQRWAAAEAYVKYAESEVRRLEAAVAFYRGELARAQALARTQAVSVQALDKARFDAESNEAALVSAKAQVTV